MFEVGIYPIYGAAIGAEYSNDEIDNVQLDDDKKHTLNVYILLFGIMINLYTERDGV